MVPLQFAHFPFFFGPDVFQLDFFTFHELLLLNFLVSLSFLFLHSFVLFHDFNHLSVMFFLFLSISFFLLIGQFLDQSLGISFFSSFFFIIF